MYSFEKETGSLILKAGFVDTPYFLHYILFRKMSVRILLEKVAHKQHLQKYSDITNPPPLSICHFGLSDYIFSPD